MLYLGHFQKLNVLSSPHLATIWWNMGKFRTKGLDLTAKPITSKEDLEKCRRYFKKHKRYRDLCIFDFCCNSGLRTCDILSIKVLQVQNVRSGSVIKLTESKTKKKNSLTINVRMLKSLSRHLNRGKLSKNDFLFKSPKTGKALTSMRMGDIVKEVTSAVGLVGQYSAHSMRKTFGYFHYKIFETDPLLIQKRYNHDSLTTTFRYIGITEEQVSEICMMTI